MRSRPPSKAESLLSKGWEDLEKNMSLSALRHYCKLLFGVWRKKQRGSEKGQGAEIDSLKHKSLGSKITKQQFSLITAG